MYVNTRARSNIRRFKDRQLLTEVLIAEALRSVPVIDDTFVAKVIAASAYGISLRITDPAEMSEAIPLLCQSLANPVLART